jgi:hypothetical protein
MLFPNEIWKLIQRFSPILYQQRKHCETILSYYDDPDILNSSYYYVNNRNILSKLIETALRYNQCVNHLNKADGSFNTAVTEFTKHGKVFKLMDNIESLLTHIWMLKFH